MFWVVFCLGRHGWRFELRSMVSVKGKQAKLLALRKYSKDDGFSRLTR